jgi:acyl carrier protein
MTALAGLIAELKTLVLDATEKAEPEGGLSNDEPLFGPDARLDLDSLDALQVSMAIQERFGVRITDSKQTRLALRSIGQLAQYVHSQMR